MDSLCDHLKMLSKSFSNMDNNIWEQCPSSTNAVEQRNRDYTTVPETSNDESV